MVRAWGALACGLKAVLGLSSTSTAGTPRRPSSLASMSPHGPPPTISTAACVGISAIALGYYPAAPAPALRRERRAPRAGYPLGRLRITTTQRRARLGRRHCLAPSALAADPVE